MFLDSPGNVSTAIDVVVYLAPAFAAGFAVQRFLDIVDSWFDLDKKLSEEWKKAILSIASLIIGVFLAYRLGIRVLAVLGPSLFGETLSAGLDYLVSGLIISAGTDGFNSIIKFMSYTKEVKKAERETAEQTAISARSLNLIPTLNSLTSNSIINFQKTGDLLVDLEKSLHDEIKATWKDKFNEAAWLKTPFNKYTSEVGDGKEVVLDATLIVAQAYSRVLTKNTRKELQALVDLETAPEDIIPNMRNAVLFNFA